jgi:transposase
MRDQARNGAPDAVQIADRFHVLMNVTTAMARFFERKHDTLKHIYEQEKALDPPVSPPVDTDPPTKPPSVSQQQQQRAAQGKLTAPLSAREAAWLFVCPPPK